MELQKRLLAGTPGRLLVTLIMLALAIVMVMPFLWMISTSLKTPTEVFKYPI